MKKTGKTARKAEPLDFKKFTFWFPILYAVVNMIFLSLGASITVLGSEVASQEVPSIILKVFFGFVALGPSAMIIFAFMFRSMNAKYPAAPSYYRSIPGILGMMVALVDIVLLVSFVGSK